MADVERDDPACAALEQDVGAPLLTRSGRTVIPTEAGARVLSMARPLLQAALDLRAVAADDLWLSSAYGTDVVGIHFTWLRDQAGVEAVLPLVEAALLPLGALAEVEGRGIEHAQRLGAGRLRGGGGLVEPGVLADQQREARAAHLEDHRRLTGVAPGQEVAPLVEHLVVGQLALAVRGHDPAAGQHRRGIEALLHGQRLRPNIAALTELMRMTDHHVQAFETGQRLRDADVGQVLERTPGAAVGADILALGRRFDAERFGGKQPVEGFLVRCGGTQTTSAVMIRRTGESLDARPISATLRA